MRKNQSESVPETVDVFKGVAIVSLVLQVLAILLSAGDVVDGMSEVFDRGYAWLSFALTVIFVALVGYLLILGIVRFRNNMVRWVYIIVGIAWVPLQLFGPSSSYSLDASVWISWFSFLTYLASVYLLFMPETRAWIKSTQ